MAQLALSEDEAGRPRRVAVADLGSSSLHLVVFDGVPGRGIELVARHREELPLAAAVSTAGCLGPELANRVVSVARALRAVAEASGAEATVAFATHAFRLASDADEVLARVRAEAGLDARVIPGETEARLVFTAAAASVALVAEPALVLDLGGGSLELAVGRRSGATWVATAPIGAAVLAQQAPEDPGRLAEIADGGLHAAGMPRERPRMAIGTGGTIAAVARAALVERGAPLPPSLNNVRLSADDLARLAGASPGRSVVERSRRYSISERRAETLPAGIAVVCRVLARFGLEELVLCDWGLREGMALEALGMHGRGEDPESIRLSSVLALRRRCGTDEAHTSQVALIALSLFDQTAMLHGMGRRERELLHLGALAHDVGRLVGAEGYERHSAYLIENAGLRGFSPEEVAVLACLGRYHRRGTPKVGFGPFDRLDGEQRSVVARLVALLQVADSLDRGHRSVVDGVVARVEAARLTIEVSATGPAELEMWALARAVRLFEKTYGHKVQARLVAAGGGKSANS